MGKEVSRKGAARGAKAAPEDGGVEGAPSAPPPLEGVEPMPLFPPLGDAELTGTKIEWRKVRGVRQCRRRPVSTRRLFSPPARAGARSPRLQLPGPRDACAGRRRRLGLSPRLGAGHRPPEPDVAAQGRLDGAVHAGDGEHEGGHAHEPEDEKGARAEGRRFEQPRAAVASCVLTRPPSPPSRWS